MHSVHAYTIFHAVLYGHEKRGGRHRSTAGGHNYRPAWGQDSRIRVDKTWGKATEERKLGRSERCAGSKSNQQSDTAETEKTEKKKGQSLLFLLRPRCASLQPTRRPCQFRSSSKCWRSSVPAPSAPPPDRRWREFRFGRRAWQPTHRSPTAWACQDAARATCRCAERGWSATSAKWTGVAR